MMLLRRPVPVFDVDLIGVSLVAALLVAAHWGVIEPLRARAESGRRLSSQIAKSERTLVQSGAALSAIQADIGRLESAIADQLARTPRANALPETLAMVDRLATTWRLQVTQVIPAPTQTHETCTTTDVRFVGMGRSADFIGFLDALARVHPYHTLDTFELVRVRGQEEERCRLKWTLRFYALADSSDAAPARGEGP